MEAMQFTKTLYSRVSRIRCRYNISGVLNAPVYNAHGVRKRPCTLAPEMCKSNSLTQQFIQRTYTRRCMHSQARTFMRYTSASGHPSLHLSHLSLCYPPPQILNVFVAFLYVSSRRVNVVHGIRNGGGERLHTLHMQNTFSNLLFSSLFLCHPLSSCIGKCSV